tara:strand:+ start:472 stop:666 length:195 start_codon:yes stop_codon:yes gene_type:complete
MTEEIPMRSPDVFITQAKIISSTAEGTGTTPLDVWVLSIDLSDRLAEIPAIELHEEEVDGGLSR